MKTVEGCLIIMSGPSGVGKGTIRKALMNDTSLNLAYSISMTTRPKRNGEINGVDYYFVSHEEFEQNIRKDKLLEWAEFVGNKYGTPAREVERLRALGKNVILEIEVNGAKQVIDKFKDDQKLITIFIIPPSLEELENRIRARSTESNEVIEKRLNKARNEMKLKKHYQYIILNDDPNRAALEIANIIKNH